jgi:hypothetical protein
VEKGGDGYPDNLIALCPNCHATVHQLRKTARTGDEIGLYYVGNWVEEFYKEDAMYLLGSIAFGTAIYFDGKWSPRDNPLMVKE